MEPVVHVIVHLLEHASQHRADVVPDDAHVIGIVVQVEQMHGIRVHHRPVDVEQRDVAGLFEQPESADAAPAFDDARLVQACGQFADVAGVGAYAHGDLLGIDRRCGLRDQDQRMDCGRESGIHHNPFLCIILLCGVQYYAVQMSRFASFAGYANVRNHHRRQSSVIVSDTDTLTDVKTSVNGSDAMAVQEVGQSVERLTRSGVVPFFHDKAMRHLAPLLRQRIDELIRHSGLAQRTTRPVSDQDMDA